MIVDAINSLIFEIETLSRNLIDQIKKDKEDILLSPTGITISKFIPKKNKKTLIIQHIQDMTDSKKNIKDRSIAAYNTISSVTNNPGSQVLNTTYRAIKKTIDEN